MFGPTLEGLFIRGLADKVDEPLRQRLAAEGLDLSQPLLPGYSRAVVNRCIGLTASHLYPDLPAAEAWYQVGKHVAAGIKKTTMGSAVMALIRLVGPRRSVLRMPRTFSGTNNYMQVALRELSATQFELDLRPSSEQPSYMKAVIEDILTHAGAQQLSVAIKHHDVAQALATYSISWAT